MRARKRWGWVLGALMAACGGAAPAGPGDPSGTPTGSEAGSEAATVSSEGSGPANESAAGGEAVPDVPVPPKGTSGHEVRSAELKFSLTLSRGKNAAGVKSGSWSLREDRLVEVLESNLRGVQKLEVAYGKSESAKLLGQSMQSVTAGKAYRIDASGHVTTHEGKAVGEEESLVVNRHFPRIGKKNALAEAVAGAEPGKAFRASSVVASALLGSIPGIDPDQSKLEVTLAQTRDGKRKAARLDVTGEAHLVTGQTDFVLKLGGVAEVDVQTGWITELRLEGPVKPTGKLQHGGELLDVSGSGDVVITRKTKVEP